MCVHRQRHAPLPGLDPLSRLLGYRFEKAPAEGGSFGHLHSDRWHLHPIYLGALEGRLGVGDFDLGLGYRRFRRFADGIKQDPEGRALHLALFRDGVADRSRHSPFDAAPSGGGLEMARGGRSRLYPRGDFLLCQRVPVYAFRLASFRACRHGLPLFRGALVRGVRQGPKGPKTERLPLSRFGPLSPFPDSFP